LTSRLYLTGSLWLGGSAGYPFHSAMDPLIIPVTTRQEPIELMQHLEGTWRGEGVGQYPPTLPKFKYIQELTFRKAIPHDKKNLNWKFSSVMYHKDTNEGLSSEEGFIRFHPTGVNSGRVELSCIAPTGLCEIDEGTYTEDSFDVWTRHGGLTRTTTTARPFVTEVRRWCEIRPQNTPITMEYKLEMATENTPMQTHLTSRLEKVLN